MIGRVFLNRYEAVRLLGEGGMGRVYLARDLQLSRQVAIKVMHEHIAADPKFRQRFDRETELMARFQHPHAVTLHDAKLDEPLGPCIVMEYIKGVNLDQLLARCGKFTPARVGRLVGQLCEVLQAAHDENIIHRDLKPANLMVIDAETPKERIKVMDFGLAKLLDQSVLTKKVTDTNIDFAVGTPGYICPEQVRGEEMDHRGDIYSVGVIIYELLTGRLPFPGPTSMDMLLAHATEQPPTFTELGLEGWVPWAIEELVLNCLAKNPEERPQSARDLADRYETALAHQQALADATPPPPSPVRSTAAQQPTAVAQSTLVEDPNALVFQMEAWMPEKIAIPKIRGFVHDVGGEVIESVPGLIRVRVGSGRGRNSWAGSSSGPLSWLGFGRRGGPIDMELRLQQIDPFRENKLSISVLFRPPDHASLINPAWRERCTNIYCEVRAYLMGTTETT